MVSSVTANDAGMPMSPGAVACLPGNVTSFLVAQPWQPTPTIGCKLRMKLSRNTSKFLTFSHLELVVHVVEIFEHEIVDFKRSDALERFRLAFVLLGASDHESHRNVDRVVQIFKLLPFLAWSGERQENIERVISGEIEREIVYS